MMRKIYYNAIKKGVSNSYNSKKTFGSLERLHNTKTSSIIWPIIVQNSEMVIHV